MTALSNSQLQHSLASFCRFTGHFHSITCSITDSLSRGGGVTSGDHLTQLSCSEQGQLQEAARYRVRSGFEFIIGRHGGSHHDEVCLAGRAALFML